MEHRQIIANKVIHGRHKDKKARCLLKFVMEKAYDHVQ